jgi:hypothetical protein
LRHHIVCFIISVSDLAHPLHTSTVCNRFPSAFAAFKITRDKTHPPRFFMTLLNSYKNFYKMHQEKRYNDGIPSIHNNTVYEEVSEENTYESIQS